MSQNYPIEFLLKTEWVESSSPCPPYLCSLDVQQRTIFYCKFEPKRTGTHFVSDFPDCLPTTTVPPQKQILHRGPQPRRVNTTTTLLVARARTQTCSRVRSVCRRRHASHLPALMSLLQSRACTLSAELLPTPSKILPHLWVDTDFL